jgi:hypothetical protein
MRYSDTKTTGSVPPAASGAAAGSRPALVGAVSDIILAVSDCQIAPGETARFPFAARTAYGIPSAHEFDVISDNPDFNPAWVRIGQPADGSYGPRYVLEICPGDIVRSQFGAYPLRLSWRPAGMYRHAEGRCTLAIRPPVRAVTDPAVEIWPAGKVCMLLENCGSTGIDASVSIRQRGSDWSKKWDFDLPAKDDPFSFSGLFDPPAGKRSGEFDLAVSVAGVSLVRRTVRARRPLILRRRISDMQISA